MKIWKLLVGFIIALAAMIFNMYISNVLKDHLYLQIIGYVFIIGGVWFASTSAKENGK